jgi:hypothetical protein
MVNVKVKLSLCLAMYHAMKTALYLIKHNTMKTCRSQWPRDLRQVLSSAARTLGSQVRILIGAWMCVCVYCVVSSCVGRGLASG